MTPGPSCLSDPAGFWNGRYAERGYAQGEPPHDILRDQAATQPPKEALSLAEGKGRNAVPLAQRGHDMVAQDLSAVELAKAEVLAQTRGATIGMHLPPALRAVRRLVPWRPISLVVT